MADDDSFGEDYLFFYAEDASEASVKRDADAILRMLDLAPGSSILEVGCGEGRLLRELARRGYRAAGDDRSSSKMIEAALEKGAGDAVTYFAGDVRDMPPPSRSTARSPGTHPSAMRTMQAISMCCAPSARN